MPQVVLAIMLHPDDAEFFAGGMLAQRAGQGDVVQLAIATDGALGSFSVAPDKLAGMRRNEAQRAASILGIKDIAWLGHPGGGLDGLPAGQLRLELVRLIRKGRPDVVVSLDPHNPTEHHSDHRALARAVVEALMFSPLPLFDPGGGEQNRPHMVAKKYFALDSAEGAHLFIDITDVIDRKLEALHQHKSQVDFLVEDVALQLRLAGVSLALLLGAAGQNPGEALPAAVRMQVGQLGETAGFEYSEAFRRVRFHPSVENTLADMCGSSRRRDASGGLE